MKSHIGFGRTACMAGLATLSTWGVLVIPLAGVLCRGGPAAAGTPSNSGPVRLARFSYVSNNAIWRPDEHASWSRAVRNLPLRQGAQIAADKGSRAEIQFDDGSRLWLATGAIVTLRSLYSDSDGEFTQLTLRRGTMGLSPRNARSVYEVDTPFVSVNAAGPSRFRVDATYGVQVREREGRVTVRGARGKATMDPGDYLYLRSANDPYDLGRVPRPDAFDNWSSGLYEHEQRYRLSPNRRYVPSNVAIVSDELDDYGTWRTNQRYGKVWYPRERHAGWRPYHSGHWVWVSPFGWTWVADEPWGWAPYHYGSWIHEPDGWAWVPGPSRQYWSPGTVEFSEANGYVAWCPLAPAEVRYPRQFSVSYRGGDWALSFSIGAAAVYYPTEQGYCVPRPWSSGYVNNSYYVNSARNINNYYGGAMTNHNSSFVNRGYIPVNARSAAGASQARSGAFGGWGNYQSLPAGAPPAFSRGRRIGAPNGRYAALAGPPTARLTPIGLSPTRSLQRGNSVPNAALARPVYQSHGAPGNRVAVQQARTLGAAAAIAVGHRAAGRTAPGRAPNGVQRNSAMARPSGAPVRSARPSNQRAPHPTTGSPASRAQQAANQARSTIGQHPRTGAVGRTGNGSPNRTANHAAQPRAQRQAPQQNRQQAQPRAQRQAPQQNRQQAQPRAQRQSPQQNRQQAQPRAQRQAPQQNRQQAQPRAQRQAPQQNRQQAQPRAQRQAPQQNRQQAQPRAQRQAPQQNRQQGQQKAPRASGQSGGKQKQNADRHP